MNLIVALSKWEAEEIRDKYGLEGKAISIYYNGNLRGVTLEFIYVVDVHRLETHRRWGKMLEVLAPTRAQVRYLET